MYKAKNGLIIQNSETPTGWTIRNGSDIVLYLTGLPCFVTVAEGFLLEALEQAIESRKECADIDDLAGYIAEHFI